VHFLFDHGCEFVVPVIAHSYSYGEARFTGVLNEVHLWVRLFNMRESIFEQPDPPRAGAQVAVH
jgi:hypothetical protein